MNFKVFTIRVGGLCLTKQHSKEGQTEQGSLSSSRPRLQHPVITLRVALRLSNRSVVLLNRHRNRGAGVHNDDDDGV